MPVPHPPRTPSLVPRYRKGEVWTVVDDPQRPPVGVEIWPNRPALIVSTHQINDRSGFVCIVYLSSSPNKRTSPTHVEIPSIEGRSTTMALCEQVHTVDTSRLVRRLGSIPPHHLKDIDAAIAFTLSLGRNPDTYGLFKKWESYVKEYGIDLKAEINALVSRTTDERVEALRRALDLMTTQRDAYRELADTQGALPEALAEVTRTTNAEDRP